MLQIGKEYGLDTKNFDSCDGRIRYGDGEKSIGIWSHLDVVPVGGYWEHDPFEPVVEQGYMIAVSSPLKLPRSPQHTGKPLSGTRDSSGH